MIAQLRDIFAIFLRKRLTNFRQYPNQILMLDLLRLMRSGDSVRNGDDLLPRR
jgi:hypothetical protein